MLVKAVKVPRADLLIGNKTRSVQHSQVARDGGTADRQLVGNLLDRSRASREQLDDRTAVRVAKGIEGIPLSRGGLHLGYRNGVVTVT